jgi:multidrug efflux system membrane fusion protein
MFKSITKTLEQKPYILAIIISLLLIAWMASGSSEKETAKEHKAKITSEVAIPKVEVTTFEPMMVTRDIQVYGRTEPNNVLALSAEIEGTIEEIRFIEGQSVKKGDVIATIRLDDKTQQIAYAKALVKQRDTEYKAAKAIFKKGLYNESTLAESKTALEAAKASLAQAQLNYEKSFVKAPFDGVLNARHIEPGSFVRKADTLFELVALNPLVVNASVTEQYIDKLNKDNQVSVRLANGKTVAGKIRYIASYSSKGTNTFPVEVTIDNPEQKMKAGVSTEMTIMFQPEEAIKVSPALMSLDKDGNIGVKTVVADRVVFTPIDIIKAESDGVWLGGFNGTTNVITLGQGFVRPGDQVEVSIK